jgi:hypothetical protein
MKIEKIEINGKIVAMIIRKNLEIKENTKFLTPDNYPLQLGFLSHKKGDVIKPHVHKKIKRTINITQEIMYIEKGKVRIDFYSSNNKKIKSSVLTEGDIIIFDDCGHGFEMLEDTKIIEVKQGPYMGVEVDKKKFDD